MSTKTNPAAVVSVNASPRTATPSSTATAGLMNVINVAFVGPISAISAKKIMKATPVQIDASATIAAITFPDGMWSGRTAMAIGM